MYFSSATVFLVLSAIGSQAVPFALPRQSNSTLARRQHEPYSVVNVGGTNINSLTSSAAETVTAPSVPQAPVTVTVTDTPSSTPVISPSSSSTPSSSSLAAWPTSVSGEEHPVSPRSFNHTQPPLPLKEARRSFLNTNSTRAHTFGTRSVNGTEGLPIAARGLLNSTITTRQVLNQTGRVY
ncbi:uncharacterized protein ACLA_038270 [Aspergillus clavatus NRRL 1]|uniref:Uncharacterized protein n=1 Tax=Aspergillus clavatus (strain ATCC 1007 / CBS 513.65 / DSM 816 / NCTC 3887 / NRRL 1 / QM 1276 / 107) TaxID=344612 RepID=A1CKE2_ASPCL|nr:uncharacterized protein ACLA_038270 [Aspergillus clavatus NRRL 1]EAW09616.1 conserved hypothetical protein [Aspergillus clavatus NRRL 1]